MSNLEVNKVIFENNCEEPYMQIPTKDQEANSVLNTKYLEAVESKLDTFLQMVVITLETKK
jgi:hypothetical protein